MGYLLSAAAIVRERDYWLPTMFTPYHVGMRLDDNEFFLEGPAIMGFTGGLDSTVLAYMLANNPKISRLRLLSIRSMQITRPGEIEAQDAVVSFLKKNKLKNTRIEHVIYSMPTDVPVEPGQYTIQPIVLSHLAMLAEKDENVYIGYVDGDGGLWKVCPDFYAAYEGLMRIYGRSGSLLMPLRYERKSDLLAVVEATPGLSGLPWWCESNYHDKSTGPCGACHNCFETIGMMAEYEAIKKEARGGIREVHC